MQWPMQRFYSLIVIFLALVLSNNYAFSQSAENQNPVNPSSPTSSMEGSKSKGIGHSKWVVTALSQRGSDNEINHLIDVLPLFSLTNDSIIQPIDLSADYTGMPLVAWKVIISKDSLTHGIKHAYGFVPHHHGVGLLPTHTLILVDNPMNMRYHATRIWVDLNHNFDLTDDGPAQWYLPMKLTLPKLNEGNRVFSQSLILLDTMQNGMAVGFNQFMPGELRSVQKMYDDAIALVCGRREYLGCNASFRQHRKAVWFGGEKANNSIQNDTLYWAVKDVNLNGLYNDIGIDKVIVGNNRGEFSSSNAWDYRPGMIVDWLGQAQLIENVNQGKDGIWVISHRKIKNVGIKGSRSLLIGEKLPKFKFCLIEGKYQPGKLKENPVHRRSIRNFKGKYTYVVVWNADNPNYINDSAELHDLSRNLPDSIQIVCLNHGGGGRYVYQYNKRYETRFIQGFCSSEVAEKLKLQTMPQYFLIDPKQRLISINQRANTLKKE
jgi:hypothetical protein